MFILYILGAFVAAFVLLQLFMVFKMRLKKGKPAPELGGKMGALLGKGEKAAFYFHSPSCGACRSMTPIIEEYTGSKKNLFSINIMEDMDTARKFGILGTPSLVIVEEGTIREFLVGAQSRERLASLLS